VTQNNIKISSKLSFKVTKGERISVVGDAVSRKELILYFLRLEIFDSSSFQGQIVVNQSLDLKDHIIEGLCFFHANEEMPETELTVKQMMNLTRESLDHDSIDLLLSEFFTILGTRRMFNSRTNVESMTATEKQLLLLFKILKVQDCSVLVVMNALDRFDIITHHRISEYLIKQSKIGIVF
jgi:hypothetical protein